MLNPVLQQRADEALTAACDVLGSGCASPNEERLAEGLRSLALALITTAADVQSQGIAAAINANPKFHR